MRERLGPVLALVLVTALWGFTFVPVKQAVRSFPPLEFLALRFLIALAAMVVISPGSILRLRRNLAPGLICGAALAAGYATQTIGLKMTTATKAGLITGLFVVFTPVLSATLLRRMPPVIGWVAVALSTGGLYLLTSGPYGSFNLGDAIILFTALFFALHVIALGRYSPVTNTIDLTTAQMFTAAAAFVVLSLLLEPLSVPRGGQLWMALLVTGVGASAVAFFVQTWAQKKLTPNQTAVTLAMEPVFAGVAGAVLLGERLTATGWIGAAMILTAMLLADLNPKAQEAPL